MKENTDGTLGGAAVDDGVASANDQWSALVASASEPTPAPEPATPTAGAVVEPPAPATPAAAGDDGAKGDTPPATPAVPATPNADAAPAAEAPKTDEPTVEAKPFEFVVDGKIQALEGAAYVPGEGVFVPDAQVPALRRMAAQAVTLERQNKDLASYKRELDGLTEWKTTGPDGKEVSLTGRQGVEALHVAHGTTKAALESVVAIFAKSPTEFIAQNEKGEIVWDPRALRQLSLEAKDAERTAQDAIRTKFPTSHSRPATPAASPSPEAPSVDWTRTAPVIVQKTAEDAGLDVSGLTADDQTFLAGMVPRFARPATAQDQEVNPALTLGETVIDAAFAGVVQDRLNLRLAASKAVKAAEAAAPFNAGMNKGTQPKPAAPPAPKAPVGRNAPKERTAKSANDMWSDLVSDAKTAVGGGV